MLLFRCVRISRTFPWSVGRFSLCRCQQCSKMYDGSNVVQNHIHKWNANRNNLGTYGTTTRTTTITTTTWPLRQPVLHVFCFRSTLAKTRRKHQNQLLQKPEKKHQNQLLQKPETTHQNPKKACSKFSKPAFSTPEKLLLGFYISCVI